MAPGIQGYLVVLTDPRECPKSQLFAINLRYSVTYLILTVAGGILFTTLWALTIATVGATVTSLIRRLRIIDRYVTPKVSRDVIAEGFRRLPELIRFGIKTMPGALANGVSNESAVWVLGITAPVASVGAYSRAWSLAQRFRDLNRKVTEVLFPTIVARRSAGDDGRTPFVGPLAMRVGVVDQPPWKLAA